MSRNGGRRGADLGAVLFACLLVLTFAAFAVERAARSADDLVNTVVLSPQLEGGRAEVRFTLAEPDSNVDVLIIDGNEGSNGDLVATLASGEDLAAGPHTYEWDGRTDSGERAPPGLYALEVVLGEQGRDVKPPGRIEVNAPPTEAGSGN
ncbi:MAG TPA: FlgD immunoglobulin-like domain containing protein [Solirubrobacterales bacterium]|jgi:flagellar hook assembly protein FlgD|nr:FlgD immunoglobulin-like domain containing protein [Solirubrobacterales bacterium]